MGIAIMHPKPLDTHHVEERLVRQADFDMRLMINRPHGYMRIMDYRSGNYDDKRALLDTIARQEKLRKVFTVVEKQDSNSWRSNGFIREGVYPSFFRTADAYMMSRVYTEEGEPHPVQPLKPSSDELIKFPARKLSKPSGLTIGTIKDEAGRATVLNKANGDLRVLPFARVKAPDLVMEAKARKKKAHACSEIDESFAHATVGFAPTPSNDTQLVLCAYAGNALMQELNEREVANVFGVTPTADRWANELFSGLGFKVTGRLAGHLDAAGERQNALLWHRRLAPPRD